MSECGLCVSGYPTNRKKVCGRNGRDPALPQKTYGLFRQEWHLTAFDLYVLPIVRKILDPCVGILTDPVTVLVIEPAMRASLRATMPFLHQAGALF